MRLAQAIMRVCVEINEQRFFECRRQLFLQGSYKFCYPTTPVVIMPVTNKYVVF